MEAEPRPARTIHPRKRARWRPPTPPPLNRAASSTVHTQQLEVAPACSLLGSDDGGLMSVFSSQVTGAPAHAGDPLSVSSSYFPRQPAPVLRGDPMSMQSSEFIWAAMPIHDGDLQSVLSSQFTEASAPVQGGDLMSRLSSEFTGASGPTHDGDLESVFSSQFFTGAAAPALDGDVESVFSSLFPEATAPAHDGNPNTVSLSQYTTAPGPADDESVFTSQFTGARAPGPADDESVFTSQFTGARAPVHGGDPMPVFSSLVHDGDPMSVFSGQLTGAAPPMYGGYPMPVFSGQLTGAAPPMYGGYPMPVFPSHLTGAAAPMHGGYQLPVFPSQLTGGTGLMRGGYPMSVSPSQFMGAAGPVQLKGAASPAPAPAYSDDPMFVFHSQSKRAPALKPWTGEDLLFDQVPRACPNDSNLREENWKIVDGKAQSPGCWNDGIVDNSRDQNDQGDGSFKVVLQNVSLPPPTNLLQGRGPPPRPRQTAAKKRKRRANVAWTVEEQRLFLKAMAKCPKGDWKSISRFLKTRTPTQVASHAQKYQMRQKDRAEGHLTGKRKSIHDITLD